MKKLLISFIILLAVSACAEAAKKKPIKDVNTDAMTKETQVTPQGSGGNHIALAWWVPNEFWEAVLSKDTTTSEAGKKAMLDAMSSISLLAVVQADISPLGTFDFYSKEEIEKEMKISFTDADGKKQNLSPMETISPDLKTILDVFKPILGAAMGNLGHNMHFYVLSDKTDSSARLLDPYKKGQINIKLSKRNKQRMTATIETPLNSLYVPRKCPNGKDAHVSWKYCPWTGKKLED